MDAIDKFLTWYAKASSADRITAGVLIGIYLMCLGVSVVLLWHVGHNLITYGTWRNLG